MTQGRRPKCNSFDSIRKELARIQDEVMDYLDNRGWNADALAKAQNKGHEVVIQGVTNGYITPVEAETLRLDIANWG